MKVVRAVCERDEVAVIPGGLVTVVEVIMKDAEGAFKNVSLSNAEELHFASTSWLPSLPALLCCALSFLFNCYVNAEALCFQQEATDWCSNSLKHATVICPPKLRGINWRWLTEMCMLMCIKRSPLSLKHWKQAGITVGDSPLPSFTPWVLLKKTRSALLCVYCIAISCLGCEFWRLLLTTPD